MVAKRDAEKKALEKVGCQQQILVLYTFFWLAIVYICILIFCTVVLMIKIADFLSILNTLENRVRTMKKPI